MAERSLNKVMLIGRLGGDAETKYTPSGVAVSNFNLATSRSWKNQQTGQWEEATDWHRVVAWRQENLAQCLTKGTKVYVEGRLSTRKWEDHGGSTRYTTEVVAEEIILLYTPGNEPREHAEAQPAPAPVSQSDDSGITDDDLPF